MKKGFTLIELLIVISIIGILAVALLPNILSAPATARDAGRKASLNSVIAALEQYKSANGAYPGTLGTVTALPAGLNTYFKGGSAPVGSAVTTAETVLELSVPVAATSPVVYCPLKANAGGYSYVAAIRMEQPQAGANGLDITKLCSTATGAALAGSSNWFFQVQ